jgi:N-acetylglucosaminyldiphosphoundecaprenol N-acetyl-beta-D-mannosaminyltransferase
VATSGHASSASSRQRPRTEVAVPERPTTLEVLGYRVAAVDLAAAADWLLSAASEGRDRLVVTLNPELVVRASEDTELRSALAQADLTVADGVGLLWAARREGRRLPGRVPGVDLAARVMALGGSELRVFFLGGKPGVAERAAAVAGERWRVVSAGHHHGYFGGPRETSEVIERVRAAAPDLLLAGLGESQELFLAGNRAELGARLLMGVGGTLDVLAGEAKRTPAWTRRASLEWAWRVGLDPRRWHRIPRLVRFVRLVLAHRRGRS